MFLNDIEIKTLPACRVYTAEYDLPDLNAFFNPETGENILYDLQYLMESENPELTVPDAESGEDYNYFEWPPKAKEDGTMHIVYNDMVLGQPSLEESPTGMYRFRQSPEVKVAAVLYQGPFEKIGEGHEALCKMLEGKGYSLAGESRIAAVHGPWDRENPEDYVSEFQVIIRQE